MIEVGVRGIPSSLRTFFKRLEKLLSLKRGEKMEKMKAPSLEVNLRLGEKEIKAVVSGSTHEFSGQSKVEVDEQNLEK